jgi:hypothetical protein
MMGMILYSAYGIVFFSGDDSFRGKKPDFFCVFITQTIFFSKLSGLKTIPILGLPSIFKSSGSFSIQ